MNVLVLRPDERGQQLVESLTQQQIFAMHQPLFRVEAGRELPHLPPIMSSLKVGDYVFAVSKNAVDFAHQTLLETGFNWRNDLHYFAVGRSSANYFASYIQQAVRYPTKFANSEGLLALPEMSDLTNKTIVILRAESGREYFTEQAQLRGAEVKVIECYQRIVINDSLQDKISLAKRAGIDTIVATSSDIVSTLVTHTQEHDKPWLFDCQLVVVSERIAQEAQQFGWHNAKIMISNNADNLSLLETLLATRT